MSEPIKLKNAGDRHTMDVASCVKLAMGRYPEYEFTGKDGSVVRVPEQSTIKQLTRLELTPESVVGRRVTLKRDASNDPAKPYWGIYLEEGGGGNGTAGAASAARTTGQSATHTTTSATQPTPAPQSTEKPHGYALYRQITAKVLDEMVPLYEAAGVPLNAEAAAAIVATIFIQAERNGH